jgi:hypothetical protein
VIINIAIRIFHLNGTKHSIGAWYVHIEHKKERDQLEVHDTRSEDSPK